MASYQLGLHVTLCRRYSLLRFMAMQNTNAQTDMVWSDRKQVGDRSYHDGVPVERMILLANVLGADAWFCIPHAADDDYITHFAQMALDTLRPDVKVYVEYSNEVPRDKALLQSINYIPDRAAW